MTERGDARLTVGDLLRRNAADAMRVFAVLDGGETITYAEQLGRSRRVAGGLREAGARPGDRVHVQLGNCRQFFDVWFATALSGTILVPTGPQSSADELAHVLSDSTPAVSLRSPSEVDALHAPTGADVEPGDVAAILYTSGTTSRAKGVMVTDANYVAVGTAVATHLGLTAADRWLVVLPLFHANAQYYCAMSALVSGGSIALAPRFSASNWGRQARELGATVASLFAAPVRMILAAATDPDDAANSVRTVLFAQNIADGDAKTFESRFGTRLVQLYGMTETVLPPTMNPDDDTRRWDSIGRALPGVTIDLGPDGEMWVTGSPVAAGYWNDPDATAATFTPEGLRTADLARRDADGFLYFVDRAKDMIKRGGENVSAGEVERVAGEHPAVADSAAVGIPDPVRDEAILLVVTLRPGASVAPEELLTWCRERLSPFKVPSVVKFVDALPRTSVGKVRKAELRARSL
ncbi:class I adenylate-forming enzyme family protein [Cryptosporangium sp. NPDC051539]|uniref:class I adenylate-forming enzyme family protein n=1 Tax=Cryptosporangium sp. NPDC051539 TaxID=3363962 RepID=UPI00378F4035